MVPHHGSVTKQMVNVKHNHCVHLWKHHLGIKIIKEMPTLSHPKAEFIYEIYC